jgi:hypothetical protein
MTNPLDQKAGTPYGTRIFRHVIPTVYQEALAHYAEHHSTMGMTPPLSTERRLFLNACLRGNLRRVIGVADHEMIDILPALVRYMELILPEGSWGTLDAWNAWTCRLPRLCEGEPRHFDATITILSSCPHCGHPDRECDCARVPFTPLLSREMPSSAEQIYNLKRENARLLSKGTCQVCGCREDDEELLYLESAEMFLCPQCVEETVETDGGAAGICGKCRVQGGVPLTHCKDTDKFLCATCLKPEETKGSASLPDPSEPAYCSETGQYF